MSEFHLDLREISTPLWGKLKAHYEARLAELRVRNDKDRPESDTIRLRAEIKTIKGFLALENQPEPEQEVAAGE